MKEKNKIEISNENSIVNEELEKEKNKYDETPPEFDISEIGRDIKTFYKTKDRFAKYLTITIFLGFMIGMMFLIMYLCPVVRNAYIYASPSFTTQADIYNYLNIYTIQDIQYGTNVPIYKDITNEETGEIVKELQNGYALSLNSWESYFLVTNLQTVVVQTIVLLLGGATIVSLILTVRYWFVYYSNCSSRIGNYIREHKLFTKLLIALFIALLIFTIFGVILGPTFGMTHSQNEQAIQPN